MSVNSRANLFAEIQRWKFKTKITARNIEKSPRGVIYKTTSTSRDIEKVSRGGILKTKNTDRDWQSRM